MQQALREHVPTLRVSAKLDLVNRQEFDLARQRHRLDRADEIDRAGRHNLFLAGDQRHRACAAHADDPVIDLARQQPERQADHAGRVPQHAFHRQVRLAGIGRTQHRHQS